MHVGIILPNFDEHASPGGVRAVAEAAEELGFDSVWATEHIIVGPEERARPYRRVLDPLCTLAWIAGYTERIALGTSIVLVPLHHPIHLAKETTTLQELSRGRLTLGVGMGWHQDEFRFMDVEFAGRGRRADEALRLIKALWSGAPFENATFAPLPSSAPEIWVGGGSDRAVRRARELGDAWHPSGGVDAEGIRRVKQRFPELRVIPRVGVKTADDAKRKLEELEASGCEGAVLSFGTEPERVVAAMRGFAAA